MQKKEGTPKKRGGEGKTIKEEARRQSKQREWEILFTDVGYPSAEEQALHTGIEG